MPQRTELAESAEGEGALLAPANRGPDILSHHLGFASSVLRGGRTRGGAIAKRPHHALMPLKFQMSIGEQAALFLGTVERLDDGYGAGRHCRYQRSRRDRLAALENGRIRGG